MRKGVGRGRQGHTEGGGRGLCPLTLPLPRQSSRPISSSFRFERGEATCLTFPSPQRSTLEEALASSGFPHAG